MTNEQAFEGYIKFYKKQYSGAVEKNARYLNFLASIENIKENNAKSRNATFGFTKFSDMSNKEFRNKMLMPKFGKESEMKPKRAVAQAAHPGTIDWVAQGMTTAIKNQEQCGSCWAFSATETIESANLIAGKLSASNPLAPQQFVDCVTADQGCNGGLPSDAFAYVISSTAGQDTEASYPYTGEDGTCAYNPGNVGATISSQSSISQGDEDTMWSTMKSTSPLSVCCDASNWQNYQGGVLTSDQCTTNIDHAIQATGYNGNSNPAYWIIRNSWGSDWGLSGFIWLEYGTDTCGVADVVTYVSV